MLAVGSMPESPDRGLEVPRRTRMITNECPRGERLFVGRVVAMSARMFLRPMHLLLVLCFPHFCQQARKRYSAFGFNYHGQLVPAIIVFLYEDQAEAADKDTVSMVNVSAHEAGGPFVPPT